jgi:hypothetical protein
MARVGLILAAVSMLAAGGTLEVLRSGSRVDAATVRQVQARLAETPLAVGDWVGRDEDYDQKMLDRAEAQAHLYRRYRLPSGEEVTVLILAGNPQAIGAHDPTVCFRGGGLLQDRPERKQAVGPADEFWTTYFTDEASRSFCPYCERPLTRPPRNPVRPRMYAPRPHPAPPRPPRGREWTPSRCTRPT